jgi:hypothetical protein
MLAFAAPEVSSSPFRQLKEIPVSRKLAFRWTGSLLLIWVCTSAFSQEFSAEMVRQKPAGTPTTQVSVSRDKVRFDVNGQSKKSYVIIDLTKRASVMVLPDNKSYIMTKPGRIPSSIPLLHIDDPENACPAWEKTLDNPGTCKKVGEDTLNGRSMVKYTGTADNGDTGTAWVDRKLHFVVKWDGEKGAAEFQNIKEGPQDASLYQIPKDYQKLDVAAAGQKRKARPISPKPIK